ncbi:MAG: response regulator transcription factor [Anaerolineae bacterium]|nr:response regulator transcription factor [Anaerolineae bacterium]MBL6964983.1 response regulator transcription factor [Anaerolineales bacterium]
MNTKILCIEGKHAGTQLFVAQLQKKGYSVTNVSTGKAALAVLDGEKFKVAIINAPSMRTTGVRICQSVHERVPKMPIILIAEAGADSHSDNHCANIILPLPFTVRKLHNRVKSLSPTRSANHLKVGQIALDLELHHVRCQDRKSHLTPRLAAILEVLMRRAGEVVKREELFKQVWDTNFIDDTRTLDVHISWLRRAIEADPRKPKFLKTLRGVGYRLDV